MPKGMSGFLELPRHVIVVIDDVFKICSGPGHPFLLSNSRKSLNLLNSYRFLNGNLVFEKCTRSWP